MRRLQVGQLSLREKTLASSMEQKDRELMQLAMSESDAFSALTETQVSWQAMLLQL